MVEDEVEEIRGLRGKLAGKRRSLWKNGYDRGEELAQCESRDIAVDYDCGGWRRGRIFGVEVICKGGDEGAFGSVAVKANGKALGQFEYPLREGAGV